VNILPPLFLRPASRSTVSRRRPSRALGVAAMLAIALAAAGCESRRDESLAGLVVAASGRLMVTGATGELAPLPAAPDGVRVATAASGRIVAALVNGQFLVSDAPTAGQARAWRQLSVGVPPGTPSSGIDLSADGRTLAIVLGDPETPRLDLVTVDIEAGATNRRSVELMANGPPSWLRPDQLALEVIGPDQHSAIATIDPASGAMTVTEAQGIAPSATRDGSQIAVADTPSGLVVTDPATWLAGGPVAVPGIHGPDDSTIQDVALDADGTRLAIVYVANADSSASIEILRLTGTSWESVASIPVAGDAPVSIDWLD
jgi:hypothetical protein